MMSDYANSSNSELLNEICVLKKRIEDVSGTAFMRMMTELQLYQVEIELQRRELVQMQAELAEIKDFSIELYELSPLAYFSFDFHSAILGLNPAAATLLGKERASLLGVSFLGFVTRHERSKFLACLHRCISGEVGNGIEFELVLPEGRYVKVQTAMAVSVNSAKNVASCRMAFIDVTERRIVELKQRLAAKVLENSREGIILTDAQERIIAVNPAFLNMTGYEREEVIGYTPSMLKSGRHDAEFYKAMHAAFKESDGWQGEIWNRRKNGEIFQEWANIKAIRKVDGEIDCYIGIFSDISSLEEMKHKLQELAYYDELTGLVSRGLLYDRLQQALTQSRRADAVLAVLFMDWEVSDEAEDKAAGSIDNQLLQELAARLTYCMREGDTLSRLSTHEFVAILPNLEDAAVSEKIASRMTAILAKPFIIDGVEWRIECSIGITVFPIDGDEMTVLLKNADTAMCYARERGRNNYQFYNASMSDKAA